MTKATTPKAMTKSEREQLLSLVKKRERVLKHQAQERSAILLADFEQQSAKIYHWDDDAVWKEVQAEAEKAIAFANERIAARAEKIGIPPEFMPGIGMSWHGRGHNAVASRRDELRRAAKARIAAIEQEAVAKIERYSLDAQTEIVAHGIESDAARSFLSSMPPLETLMPRVPVQEIAALIDGRRRKNQEIAGYLN